MQNVSATVILFTDSAGAGIVEEITPTSLRAMINVADGANAYVHPNHTGDVTSTADGATVIATDAVTTLKIADVNVTTAKIADNAIDADKLNVSGNGTSGHVLSSDADGSFSWVAASAGGSYTASYVTSALTSWTDNNVYVFTNTTDLTHTLPASPSVGTSFKMSLRATSYKYSRT